MSNRITTVLLAASAAIAASVSPACATVVLPNLPSGSQYQLVFISDDTRDAASTNIADYNSFVMGEAAQSMGLPKGVTWHAIASTATVNANVNAPSGALPVYNTAGQLVAAAGVGIYSGSLLNAVGFNEFGNAAPSTVQAWTGSDAHGQAAGATLGYASPTPLVQGFELGLPASTSSTWLAWAPFTIVNGGLTGNAPMYALSTPITVVPEPSSVALACFAFIGLAAIARRRRKR